MIRKRTFYERKVADVFHQERFFPAGSYSWTVPEGCTSVDVFLVGGGGGTGNIASGGGGYTKTYKSSTSGYRDGGPVTVSAGQRISIIVGSGGDSVNSDDAKGYDGGYSQFMSSSYRANGGSGGEYAFILGLRAPMVLDLLAALAYHLVNHKAIRHVILAKVQETEMLEEAEVEEAPEFKALTRTQKSTEVHPIILLELVVIV